MIDKRFFSTPYLMFGIFISIMTILLGLLFFEYRSFCLHVQELVVLKQQYYDRVSLLQNEMGNEHQDSEKLFSQSFNVSEKEIDKQSAVTNESIVLIDELSVAEASDEPDDDDEYDLDEAFVVINRQSEYLKQSTLDYIESQDLNALMTTIDINQWSDYTDQGITTKFEKKQIVTDAKTKETVKVKGTVIRRPMKNFGFIWPIDADKFWLSSLFGPRKRINGSWGFHHGIDLAAVKGTVVKAVAGGTVIEASFQPGYGNTVVIKHNEKVKTRYAHLNAIRVYIGQKINSAMIVGTVGETGFIRKKGKDGSHLHFEVYERGKRINPLHCLSRTA